MASSIARRRILSNEVYLGLKFSLSEKDALQLRSMRLIPSAGILDVVDLAHDFGRADNPHFEGRRFGRRVKAVASWSVQLLQFHRSVL